MLKGLGVMAWSAPTVMVLRPVASAALSPPPSTRPPRTEPPTEVPTDKPTPVDTTSPTQAARPTPTETTQSRPREIVRGDTPTPVPTGRRDAVVPGRGRRPAAAAQQGAGRPRLASTGAFVGAAAATGAAAVVAGGAATSKARRMGQTPPKASPERGMGDPKPTGKNGGFARGSDDVE